MKFFIKPTIKSELLSISVIIASIITAISTYSHLPNKVISHWNFSGVADGWSSREFHVLFFPSLIIGMYFLFLILPNLDPKKERYHSFGNVYNVFRSMFILVFYAIFLLATLANLDYAVNIGKTVPLIIGIMMIIIGNYMSKIKNNWFVGIKTPWTLSSENVWNKTHRLGGWMFVLFGIILIIAPFLPKILGVILFIAGIICVTIIPIGYSYFLYKKT